VNSREDGNSQSRIKPNLTSSRCEGQSAARGSERRLGSGVVLLLELERNGIANLGGDVGRGVEKFSRSTDDNLMIRRSGSSGRSRTRPRSVSSGENVARNGDCGSHSDDARRSRRGRGGGGGSCSTSRCGLECAELTSGVDSENHSLLAMASLATIDPDGVCVSHCECSDGEGAIGVSIGNGNTRKR
jgi:hypothetical protein